MTDKLQRFIDDYSGCEPDEDGQWVDFFKVVELLNEVHDELFDSPESAEFEAGVNDTIDLIRKRLGIKE